MEAVCPERRYICLWFGISSFWKQCKISTRGITRGRIVKLIHFQAML